MRRDHAERARRVDCSGEQGRGLPPSQRREGVPEGEGARDPAELGPDGAARQGGDDEALVPLPGVPAEHRGDSDRVVDPVRDRRQRLRGQHQGQRPAEPVGEPAEPGDEQRARRAAEVAQRERRDVLPELEVSRPDHRGPGERRRGLHRAANQRHHVGPFEPYPPGLGPEAALRPQDHKLEVVVGVGRREEVGDDGERGEAVVGPQAGDGGGGAARGAAGGRAEPGGAGGGQGPRLPVFLGRRRRRRRRVSFLSSSGGRVLQVWDEERGHRPGQQAAGHGDEQPDHLRTVDQAQGSRQGERDLFFFFPLLPLAVLE